MINITDPEGFRRLTLEGVTAVISKNLGEEQVAIALLEFAKMHVTADEHAEVEHIQKEDPDTFDLMVGNMLINDLGITTRWLQSLLGQKRE
jgi:hypothetical protein